jgi:ribosomal protein S20
MVAVEPRGQFDRVHRAKERTTMSMLRIAGLAGLLVITALVGGTIIGSVAATTLQPTTPSSAAPAAGAAASASAAGSAAPSAGAKAAEYCADFRRAFAADLGVDVSALGPAAKAAALATIDAAVADGTMQKARGDRLKARIEAADADGCALLAGRVAAIRDAAGPATARAGLGVVKDGITAAAKALGMTPAELGAKLRTGGSLKDVATDKGVPYDTVSAAVVASVKADLDAAVAAGAIKQARVDRILARLEANLADGRLRKARPAAPASSSAPAQGS